MNSLHRRLTCRILVLGLAMAPAPQLLSGQVYTVLHDLNGTSDGAADCGYNRPVQGRDGNVYGTLCSGGVNNAGVVFKITPRWTYRVLYSFDVVHVPRWGDFPITTLQARPIELWLGSLGIAPKSRVHIRGIISLLWDYAMWRGEIPMASNPMQLVTIKGATKRIRKLRGLTVEEFRAFIGHLDEPFHTMATVSVCFGLRISECLGLKWSDIDSLNGKMQIERGIVRQHVDDVKTIYSDRQMNIDSELLEVLKSWKQRSQFAGDGDWVIASPAQLGRLPWSYPHVWRKFPDAALCAGIGKLDAHDASHLPLVVGRCGHNGRCAAKANEALGHSHHDERVWRCRDE